jgi:glycosyltransferase involved in cell wall biosynthesis
MPRAVDLLVPGEIATLTGGYLYDARILAGLERLGWATRVHALDASFPEPTDAALAAAEATLAAIPPERMVVVDGLALPGLAGALSRRREGPVVALVHHPVAYETGLDAAVAARLFERERAALAEIENVIVTGPWTRRALADFDVDAARITVVEPGTDPAPEARGSSTGAHPRKGAGGSDAGGSNADGNDGDDGNRSYGGEEPLVLVSVGSLTARKGHDVLLAALATLTDLPWQLRVAGSQTREPDTAAALRATAAKAGIAERVQWLGELAPAALGDVYDCADLFVLASHLEGYGMALAEALARGLPIVSTRAGAIPDTVPDDAGVLAAPGDAAALAAALRSLLEDRSALERLAAGARRARTRLPTWDDASRAFARALERAQRAAP